MLILIVAWLLLGVISTVVCVSAAIVAARYDEAGEVREEYANANE